MFCPRCGRPVSPTANFCGGCGLPKAEIEKAAVPVQTQVDSSQPALQVTETEMNELNSALSQLEGDLTGVNPVENYTTDTTAITNTDTGREEKIVPELKFTVESQSAEQENVTAGQSDYSRNAPQHPFYTQNNYEQSRSVAQFADLPDHNLSTVDFVWMLLISSIPVVGMFYVIYQAFVQKENVNKKSWARATIIIYLFAALLGLVFSIGLALTSFIYW